MAAFMTALLTGSAVMGVLALLTAALMPALTRRYTAKTLHGIWLVLMLGLLIPFRPAADFNLLTLNVPAPAMAPAPVRTPTEALSSQSRIVYMVYPPQTPLTPAKPFPLWEAAATLWLAGVSTMLCRQWVVHRRFCVAVKRWAQPCADEDTNALLEVLRAELGVKKPVGLYLCPCVSGAMLSGFRKPAIWLPALDYAPGEMRLILKHELVHCRRGDLWARLLVFLVTAVHWFNPAVWMAARAANTAWEMSCDARVMQGEDDGARFRYSEAILRAAQSRRTGQALTTNFYGGKYAMKKRLSMILDTNIKRTGVFILLLTLILTMAAGCAFALGYEGNEAEAKNGDAANPVQEQTADTVDESEQSLDTDAVDADEGHEVIVPPVEIPEILVIPADEINMPAHPVASREIIVPEKGQVVTYRAGEWSRAVISLETQAWLDTEWEVAEPPHVLWDELTDNIPFTYNFLINTSYGGLLFLGPYELDQDAEMQADLLAAMQAFHDAGIINDDLKKAWIDMAEKIPYEYRSEWVEWEDDAP